MNQWLQVNTLADAQRADSFGRIEVVTRHRQQVDAELVNARWSLAYRLCRIAANDNAALTSNCAISAMGCNVPTSLLACITEIRIVPG